MNELATSSDVRSACLSLERKMDEVVDDLRREMRKLKRKVLSGVTVSMALMNTVMFFALDAMLNA